MVGFLCMCGLHGLLLTFGEYFITIVPLEIYLLRKMLVCSILILPAVPLSCLYAKYDLTFS